MAISSYATATITGTDTFQNWIDETNNLLGDMATVVVTTAATTTGGQTSGNAAITGILSANTMVATDGLRGGTVSTSGPLSVVSNTTFTANTTISGNTLTVNSPVVVFSSSSDITSSGNVVLNGSTKSLTIDKQTIAISSNNFTLSSNNATLTLTNPLSIVGNVNFTGNTEAREVTANNVTVTNNVNAANMTLTTKITSANAAITKISGTDLTYTNGTVTTINATNLTVTNTISGSINGNAATVTNGVYTNNTQTITGEKTFAALKTSATVLPSANNTHNIGSSTMQYANMYAVTFNGTATKAQYADLAENYIADEVYEVGTVIAVGGSQEVTAADSINAHSVIGVVSENPAYLMNDGLVGGTAIALKGRVPVKIIGNVKKGDRLTPSFMKGFAETNNSISVWSFAIALSDSDNGLVEAIIL